MHLWSIAPKFGVRLRALKCDDFLVRLWPMPLSSLPCVEVRPGTSKQRTEVTTVVDVFWLLHADEVVCSTCILPVYSWFCAWLGPTVSIIPVAPGHIAFVGAATKMCIYRSFSTGTSRVKEAHVTAGHIWTPRHEPERTQGTRSVTRGQGPLRQSAPLPVESVAEFNLGIQALC